MFNIGFSELIVILLVALIFVGPKDLPKVGAYLGRAVRKFREYLAEFKEETGLDEMEKEYQKTAAELKTAVREADPTWEIRQVQKEIEQAGREADTALKDAMQEGKSALSQKQPETENKQQ